MRLLRRILGDPRFRKTRFSDVQVRLTLGIESLDCLVHKRRLCYLARVANCDVEPLLALLQQSDGNGGYVPWVRLVVEDLFLFWKLACFPRKFERVWKKENDNYES